MFMPMSLEVQNGRHCGFSSNGVPAVILTEDHSLNNLIATTIKFPTWTRGDGVVIEGTSLFQPPGNRIHCTTAATGATSDALKNGFGQALKGEPSKNPHSNAPQ